MSTPLPNELYLATQVREMDRRAILEQKVPGLTLMERAGRYSFEQLRQQWPDATNITVLCGTGNNGGDGFVIARLAREAGLTVRLLQLGDPNKLIGDAAVNAERWQRIGGFAEPFTAIPGTTEVIVDAILGTGLEREVTGNWAQAIIAINKHPAPVLSVDIPSGLNSDRGQMLGVAVRATITVTFVGLKRGMFTAEGAEYCGEIRFDGLGVSDTARAVEQPSALRDSWNQRGYDGTLRMSRRMRSAHKGDNGHLLVVGGDSGMGGAVRIAGEAALRSGCGLVSIATHAQHAAQISASRPELMVHPIVEPEQLMPLLERATVLLLGPGLGQSAWSRALWKLAVESSLPMVLDADGLNLLSESELRSDNWVLTPHPGEAGRLLELGSSEVQADRFTAARGIQQRHGGVVVLKGSGTITLWDQDSPPALCDDGNPGMASGGMGDALAGVIGALLAQDLPLARAARLGVCLHAAAGDAAAEQGERGLLASDLMPWLRTLANAT